MFEYRIQVRDEAGKTVRTLVFYSDTDDAAREVAFGLKATQGSIEVWRRVSEVAPERPGQAFLH